MLDNEAEGSPAFIAPGEVGAVEAGSEQPGIDEYVQGWIDYLLVRSGQIPFEYEIDRKGLEQGMLTVDKRLKPNEERLQLIRTLKDKILDGTLNNEAGMEAVGTIISRLSDSESAKQAFWRIIGWNIAATAFSDSIEDGVEPFSQESLAGAEAVLDGPFKLYAPANVYEEAKAKMREWASLYPRNST